MEELNIPESEIQLDRVRLAIIAAISFGLIFILAAVAMQNRRSLKKQTVEVIPVELESGLPISS